jgi:hypothetical protein
MNARLVFACAAAGIATTFLGAPTASADLSGTFDVTPDVVAPGETVELSATCNDPEFPGQASIETEALVPTDLTGERGEDGLWRLTGTTTVRDVEPGDWSVLFLCGPSVGSLVADFEVVAAEEPYAAIGIDDRRIKPGQEVRVSASCRDPRFTSSKIVSPVLTAPDFVRKEGETADRVLFAMGRIAADAEPGTYPISFTCVDREVTGEFTVTANVTAPAQVPVKPKGAADTGSLDPAPEQGPGGVALTLGGAALLVAGGGLGVAAYRRRRRA